MYVDALLNAKNCLGKFEYAVKHSRLSNLEKAIFHTQRI
jgi:hypothetical protein